ncbi:hypothetical protein B4900_18730 [Yersinia rohdei]|nr:hypothetical protein B4900_18730 [Yersinia rohdei]
MGNYRVIINLIGVFFPIISSLFRTIGLASMTAYNFTRIELSPHKSICNNNIDYFIGKSYLSKSHFYLIKLAFLNKCLPLNSN